MSAEPTQRIDRRGARGIVVDEQDHVLFIGRYATADRPARWLLPGGGIDPGETMAEAAVRELFEETGLRVAPEELIGPVARQLYRGSRDGLPWAQENHFFLVRAERFEPRICGGDAYEQDMEFTWVAVADLTTEVVRENLSLMRLVKRLVGGDVPADPLVLESVGPAVPPETEAAA